MTYTSTELITDAYYAAGIVSREFETVSGSQISDGLKFLNNILTEKRIDLGMVPYETKYTFTALPGVQVYFIPNLIQIDTLVFYLGDVRYSMAYTKRNQFFGTGRVENIKTLPVQWYFERKTDGGNLHIYFAPDKNYPMEIHGTFGFQPVSLNDDLRAVQTYANLGQATIYSFAFADTAILNVGSFVVNGVDLQGTYFDIGSLVNYINTGIIPKVQAKIDAQGNFILYSIDDYPAPIYIQTAGYPPNGTKFIANVKAASTLNLDATYANGNFGLGATLIANNNGALVLDGYPTVNGDIVLIKDQTSTVENGIYTVIDAGSVGTPFALQRWTNYDDPIQIGIGDLFTIEQGLTLADSTFVQTGDVNFIGTSDIVFDVFQTITFANFSTIQQPDYDIYNAIGLDEFYTTYLKYALADRLCAEFAYDTPVNIMRQLNKYEAWIEKESRTLDLRLEKSSTLQQNKNAVSWQWINLGRGWFTPS